MSHDAHDVTGRAQHPWEQMEFEADSRFDWFRTWLFMSRPRPSGCRAIADAFDKAKRDHKHLVPTYRTVQRWMTEHKWIDRANRYDAFMAGAEVDARRSAREEAAADDELAQYRDRLLSAGRVIEGLGLALAVKATKWLGTISDGEPVPTALSQLARTSESTITKGLDIQGAVLGLDDVLGTLARARQPGHE